MSDPPILEFDPSPTAILEPSRIITPADVPERAVICFFNDVITHVAQKHEMTVVKRLRTEIGRHPVWETTLHGQRLAVFHPGVGAPLAAALLEEVIALGCRKFIACGGAGVLDSAVAMGHVLVPTSAVRDEGTSYHYLPPGREVEPSPEGVAAIEATLAAHAVPYRTIKTWTTDAIYRETTEKMQRRKAEGCLAVEMEAAALAVLVQVNPDRGLNRDVWRLENGRVVEHWDAIQAVPATAANDNTMFRGVHHDDRSCRACRHCHGRGRWARA